MTTISFYLDQHGIYGFLAKGHTEYAQQGEDIVCAAVSALTQTSVIGLEEVVEADVDLRVRDGYLRCTLSEGLSTQKWNDSQIVLKTLRKGIFAIKQEYSDFLQVKEVPPCE